VVRWLGLTLALALLAGCGGDGATDGASPPAPASSHQPPPSASGAPVLATLIQQRPGALIDKITVRTDASGVFDRPSGGVGRVLREVELDASAVDELRADLKSVPRKLAKGRGALAPNGATYIVRFQGRTVVARQGREPAALRRPIRLLAGMLVGDHVRKVVGEQLGGVAGSTHATGIGKVRKAREVVFFQRQGLAGATLDTISVRADGTATHEMRHGGAGGRFREFVLRKGMLGRIRRALAKLPDEGTITRGSPPPGGANYLIRFGGRTLTGRAGGIEPAARPAVRLLDGLIDAIGVAKVTRKNQTQTR
jgi:hypothetical protein